MKTERTETEVVLTAETAFEESALAAIVRAGKASYRDHWGQTGPVVFTVAARDPWDPTNPGNR